MRVRTALRVVALVSTLAGTAAFPLPAAAATAKKTASKSAKKSSSAKSSSSKKTSTKATTAKATTPAKSSSGSSAKAAFDPVAPSTTIPAAPATTASAGGAPPQRGPTRIDFDDRLIQGQTNKSGAVYLYDRKELKQRSMIKKRETFREEIVGAVYDSEL
jgi:hypothetical protein